MASKLHFSLHLTLLPLLLLFLVSPAAAHNITRILEQFPEFSTFNSLLNSSGIAAEINRRMTITVLAVDNGAAGALSSLPADTLKEVLSVHVILDYYDFEKISNLRRRTVYFTTLFQTTGVASNRMGFLNATRMSDGHFALGSAVPGAPLAATFLKKVAARPYNISVLQISSVIIPPGIYEASLAPFRSPVTVAPESLVPAPAPVDDSEDEDVADAPEEEADAEASAPSPVADGPGGASAADADDDGSAKHKEQSSSAGRVTGGMSIAVFMAGLLCLFL